MTLGLPQQTTSRLYKSDVLNSIRLYSCVSCCDSLFYVLGKYVPYDITLREDATGAQVKMQAGASTGTAALSNNYKFIDKHVISWYIYQRMYFFLIIRRTLSGGKSV